MAFTLAQLRDHLVDLQAADGEAFAAGDHDRRDYLANAIGDTRDAIAAHEAATRNLLVRRDTTAGERRFTGAALTGFGSI